MLKHDFSGKIAFVSGAASGIGLETVKKLLESGGKVHAVDINKSDLQSNLKDLPNVELHTLDISDTPAVKSFFSSLDPIDLAVNCAAASGAFTKLVKKSEDEWSEVINVNLTGLRHCLTQQLALMESKGAGSIVNVSSVLGEKITGGFSPYCVSKAGVNQLTRSAAVEYGGKGVRINAVAPGAVQTPFLKDQFFRNDMEKNILLHRIPLKRFAKPSEIANAILWLLSDAATYVNGSIITVDGGFTASL